MTVDTGVVSTSYGMLQGTADGGVTVFRGVPYAKPPLGPLRFRPPEKPEPWSGVRDATRFGPVAPQAKSPIGDLLGVTVDGADEDCLTLNVWTPAADGGRRPVMLWLHGGAFVIGAGSQALYNGATLARRGDVVVVTINYRLGLLGFLRGKEVCGDALDSTGNEAILDQVAALEWVHDEIAAFGGDPENVTVFGESAGSISVGALLVMPRARGLFHRAIMQSGSLDLFTTPEKAAGVARAILADLGLSPDEAGRLRELPVDELLAAQNRATPRSAGVAYAPVADGDLIPDAPFDAITAGAAAGVPLLIGSNLDELKLYRFMDPALESLDEAGLRVRCEAAVPGAGPDGVPHAERLIETYRRARAARGQSTTPQDLWFAIGTDQIFRSGAMRLAELQAARSPQTFAYLFTWQSQGIGGVLGAGHALDLPFVFGALDDPGLGRLVGDTPAARALSERMQDAWIAFARTGNPATERLPAWPAYEPSHRATMLFGEEVAVVDAPYEPERAFWSTVSESRIRI
jgi:para-nitrobenzyl esterase